MSINIAIVDQDEIMKGISVPIAKLAENRAMSLPWPAEFIEYRYHVENQWKVDTLHLHKELAGKSGAFVFLAYMESTEYSGYAILKFEKREVWHTLPRESEQLALARSYSGEYANQHLPEVLHDYCLDSVTISLFSITAHGLEYVFPLAKLDAGADTSVPYVAAGLVEWNSINHVRSTDPVTASELLTKWLGYRIDPTAGGRLHDFMRQCGACEDDAGLSAAGKVYPNPLAFCVNDHGTPDIYPLLGQQHGDCHGNNILLRKENERVVQNYYLIDFALYEPQWPIFYDHAYLELSLLLDYAGLFEAERWDALLTYCGKRPSETDMTQLRPEDKAYASIIRLLRKAVEDWVEEKCQTIKASAESQQRLGRVAVGLNFANKAGLDPTLRYKSLIYSAHQLKEYFRFRNKKTPETGKALLDPADVISVGRGASSRLGDWREIWRQCSEFSAEHVYVLITGTGSRNDAKMLAALGRLKWSLILDFDPDSSDGGLLSTVQGELKKRRGFHWLTPEQQVDVNFDQGTVWLMACGSKDRPDTLVHDFKDWRFGKIRDIDTQLLRLRHQTAPRQLRVLFLHADAAERRYFEAIADRILEVFYEFRPKLIVSHEPQLPPLGQADQFVNVGCAPVHWVKGMVRHLGSSDGSSLVYLPHRVQGQESNEIQSELHGFGTDELLNIGEDLELVHPGLESAAGGAATDGFLRGNTITWMELSRAYDVQLDMYSMFRRNIVRKLEAYTNETVELSHEPGAGGSTVARRLVWDLHRDFPCAVLRKPSGATAGRVASLYRLTHLPVLLVIEAGTLTVPERERLYKAVRDENARAVFVYVHRIYNGGTPCQVRSPLSDLESKYFLAKYAQSDSRRMANLTRLASDPDMMPYRMPFFFGLYAFEENFTHVEAYVNAHLQGASNMGLTLLRYVALVSRFSQSPISRSILAAMAHRDDTEAFSVEMVLGANAGRLVVQDSHSGQVVVRIVHPLIAEQILRMTGPGSSLEKAEWQMQLESLSCEFINTLAEVCGKEAEAALHLLEQMYIQRENWRVDGRRQGFAQLIQSIPSNHGQAHVLEVLTECFPESAHFWNHRGRHSNFVLRENYRQAEDFLHQAIRLQPSDPLHYHSLGMIYRLEIDRVLKGNVECKKTKPTDLEVVREEIEGLYTLADEAFAAARRLDPESEYGYVSNIQLTFSVIEQMRNLSGVLDYAKFFRTNTRVMAWLRLKLEKAKELLDHILQLQGQDKSGHVTSCLAKYRGLLGDYEAMISGLTELLVRTDEDKSSLRRLISDCIRNHHQDRWSELTDKNLQRIRDFAAENIQTGTATRRDFINWFQAYRRLPGFDFNEAISIMDFWVSQDDPVDAHYYLFVLHFLKWQRNLTTDLSNVRRHLGMIKDQGGHKWSYEWLSKPEGRNACGLVQSDELGNWKQGVDGYKFYDRPDALQRINGVVTFIRDARVGSITIFATEASSSVKHSKIEAFFVPGTDFISGRDENTPVTAYIGFSYSGLRAWVVKRV